MDTIITALSILPFVAFGAAQSSSTASLFIPFADPQSLVASIAGSDATATSYVVNCANSAAAVTTAAAAVTSASYYDLLGNQDVCGFPSAFTVVQGPSTVHYVLSQGDNTESIDCQLSGSTQAVCTDSVTGAELLSSSMPPMATATLSATDITFVPVVITAGSASGKQTGSTNASPSATAKTTASTIGGSIASTGSSATTASTKTGSTSTSSAKTQSTNAAMQGYPAYGSGVLGALGVAVAGALL